MTKGDAAQRSRKIYRVGVLGCGEVWQWHRTAIEASPRLRCTRVFDPATPRAQAAADAMGAQVAATADDVLTAADVDVVAVLTPVFTHADLVEKGAAAGKHFMLEKPMAVTFDDGQRITRAIEQAGVKCFHPTIRALSSDLFDELKKWTALDGILGPVRAGFYHLVGTPAAPAAWLKDRNLCFPPAEYAPHVLDTFLSLTGDQPATVTCHKGNYARPIEQDDVTHIGITFQGKRYLEIGVHWVVDPTWTCGSRVTFELACESGFIRHNWFSAQWFTAEGQGEFKSTRVNTGGQRVDHYHQLLDAIENDTPLAPDHHAGLAYVRILDAALKSSKTSQVVNL